jgi:hypothetical protein
VKKVGKGKKETIKWEARMLVGDHEDYETKDRTYRAGLHRPSTRAMKKIIKAWETNPPQEEEE